MNIVDAKVALDRVIDKARVHLYKPIQIAEILYRDRINNDIVLNDLSTYRNPSKKWRDQVCLQFLGRISTSSARYQDDVFNDNAIPPMVLAVLGEENKNKKGIVEAYIYAKFAQRHSKMVGGLDYCYSHSRENFILQDFLSHFWHEPGLRRSIDKIYEIVVYALFSALLDAMELTVKISINPERTSILEEFKEFAENVIHLTSDQTSFLMQGKIHRQGITNAADRGLDLWGNFGIAIQIKHLSLTEELAQNIVGSVSADRIVIVCKDAEEKIILSLLNQIGWKSRIQAIVTEKRLTFWYEQALRGKHGHWIGDLLLKLLRDEISTEFPITQGNDFSQFMTERGYLGRSDSLWFPPTL